jgi:hypothetical protein
MVRVDRRTLLVLIAGAAIVGGFLLAAAAERGGKKEPAQEANAAARPQTKNLDWHETQGPKGERLAFAWRSFQVLRDGWRARISMTNDSQVALDLNQSERSFGLMLFASGAHSDLDHRIGLSTLPTLRPALAFEPDLPPTLDPHATWSGTISARGALVADSWVRVVFGAFSPIGRAPDSFRDHMIWITDHAYRLRG